MKYRLAYHACTQNKNLPGLLAEAESQLDYLTAGLDQAKYDLETAIRNWFAG